MKRWVEKLSDPVVLMYIHGYATISWFVLAFPSMLFWNSSIPYLVFISVYAVFASHFSSWQAARVEVRQKVDADVAEVLEEVRLLRAQLNAFIYAHLDDGK